LTEYCISPEEPPSEPPSHLTNYFFATALKNCENVLSSDGIRKNSDCELPADEEAGVQLSNSMSSMQTLLTNIQGLLKVAADNANLQEKHASFEIGTKYFCATYNLIPFWRTAALFSAAAYRY